MSSKPVRQRTQLVVHLGEGAEGRTLRRLLRAAAERAGFSNVSQWARAQLLAAAQVQGGGLRLTLEGLDQRLRALEAKAAAPLHAAGCPASRGGRMCICGAALRGS